MVSRAHGIRPPSGWLRAADAAVGRDPQAVWHPSPNYGPRRGGQHPSLIVLHYTAMLDAGGALRHLCNPEAEVSAHYLICAKGTLTQMVNDDCRAWHAGAGEWAGEDDVNSRSIGIELANTGTQPFPEPQMAALTALLGRIRARLSIPPEGVIAHSDLAPGRKIDPGPHFDWRRLALEGHAIWPWTPDALETAEPARFETALRRIGYTADVPLETRLAAFRLRFRPQATGPLCADDLAVAEAAVP